MEYEEEDFRKEREHTSGEIATMIGIGTTTVRKYALQLEKNGYRFHRSNSNARLFSAHDIMAVRYLKELREKTNITVEQAASIVCDKFEAKDTENQLAASVPDIEMSSENFRELKQMIQEQNKLLEGLIQQMNRQQEYIDEQLTLRDRTLMHTLTEKLNAQKSAAVAAAAEVQESEKQSLFSKVFKKGS
jgi:DNA-binding transcriptional MerR regulator